MKFYNIFLKLFNYFRLKLKSLKPVKLYEPTFYTNLHVDYKDIDSHIEKFGEEGRKFFIQLKEKKMKLSSFFPKN